MSDWIMGQHDMLWAARSYLASCGDALHVGMDDGGWVTTRPERSLLLLGPPRGENGVGKTSAVIVPLVLTAPGPVVSTSTKPDVMRATALARSRFGTVWHYSPDGRTSAPEGARELHWSPLQAADEWDMASITATLMVTAADTGKGVTDSTHWKTRAGDLLGPVLYFAAKSGKDLAYVLEVVHTTRVKRVLEGLRQMTRDPDAGGAANVLEGVLKTSDRELASIFSATATALSAYKLSGALRSTTAPNFDPAHFISGEPEDRLAAERLVAATGINALHRFQADTVYITSSAENQRIVAPLVIGFLAQIRKARYEAHENDVRTGLRGRAPTVLALDELFGLAPLPDLPEMLADCGSQGLPVVGALQDLSQAEVRWERAAAGFLTLFQDVLAFRGIKDPRTLEALSGLVGDWDRPIETLSTTEGKQYGSWSNPGISRNRSTSRNYTYQRERILPPSSIYAGSPHLDGALFFQGSRWQWLYSTPYYRSAPWPAVLVGAMEYMARAMARRPDERCLLPVPELDRDGGRILASLGLQERFGAARHGLNHLRPQVEAAVRYEIERRDAIARGEDPPPAQWKGKASFATLLVAGGMMLADCERLVASFAPDLVRKQLGTITGWEKGDLSSEFRAIDYQPEVVSVGVPRQWIGEAVAQLGQAPTCQVVVSFNSSEGWSWGRDFARLIARRWPVLWVPRLEGRTTEDDGRAAERIYPGPYVLDDEEVS